MPDPEVAIVIKARDLASAALKKVGEVGAASGKAIAAAFKVMAVGAVIAAGAIAAGLAKAISAFADFEKGLAEVSTLADFTAEQMDKMATETLAFSVQFNQVIGDLTKARYDIVSAGFSSMAEQMLVMTAASKTAVAGVSDVATTTDLLTTVLNAYNLEADMANTVSDILFTTVKEGKTTITELAASLGQVLPTAKAAGVGFGELSALLATLTAAGVKTPQAVTAIRGAIVALAAPTGEAAKEMENMGIRVTDVNGKLLPMLDVIKQFEGLDLATVRRLVPDQEAAKAILTAANNMEVFREKSEAFVEQNVAGAQEEAFQKMAKTVDFQLGQLEKRWSAFWAGILQGEAGERLAQSLADLNKWFDENNAVIQQASAFLADFVIALLDLVVPAIEAFRLAVTGLKIVWFSALVAVDKFVTGVVNLWNWLGVQTSEIWGLIKIGILEAVEFVIRSLANLAATVAENAAAFGITVDSARAMQGSLTSMAATVQRSQNSIREAIPVYEEQTSVLGLQAQAYEEIDRVIDEYINANEKAGESVEDLADEQEKAVAITQDILLAQQSLFGDAATAAEEDGMNLVDNFSTGMEALSDMPMEVMNSTLNGVQMAADEFDATGLGQSIGTDIANGMQSGIQTFTFESSEAAQAAQVTQARAFSTGLFNPAAAAAGAQSQDYLAFLLSQGLATGLAGGGIITKPIIAGEGGPEAIIPLGELGNMIGGGGGQKVEFIVNQTGTFFGTDAEARLFARKILTFIEEEQGRRI